MEEVFHLLVFPVVDVPELFDDAKKMGSSSFKFYETKDVISRFFRIDDFKSKIAQQALTYLNSVTYQIHMMRDKKSHILRKNLMILRRDSHDQI